MTAAPRVLVVEDEPNIRELVCLHLGLEGYVCEGLGDGQTALKRAESERFDLLVLDVMIPGIDGLSLCRAVRNGRTNRDVPILMLTARREESDKVVGLESGADDYLTKPFGVRELVARVRALLRRGPRPLVTSAGVKEASKAITYKHIEMDPARRRVRVAEADVVLTSNEFQLLYVLLSSPGIAGGMPATSPRRLAVLVASDLSAALNAEPAIEIGEYVKDQYSNVFQPFIVLMRDGREVSNHPSGGPDDVRNALRREMSRGE